MIFTNNQIQDILGIMKRWQTIFIVKQLGIDYLSQPEKDLLIAAGINLDEYTDSKGIIEHAFLWGLLAEAIGDDRSKDMDYAKFQKFLSSGNFIPLTEDERFALDQIKNRAFNDIGGLGSKIVKGTSNVIVSSNLKQQLAIKKLIQDKTIQAIQLRKGARALASELGEQTDDWNRDWLRIAHYLMHEAYNTGRAQSIFKSHGEDAEIYFDVYPGACNSCKRLYLTDPDNPDSEPIIFNLAEVIANGNNIGRKVKDWLATINPTHPYCRCTVNYKRRGYAWNPDLRAYTIPIKVISKHPKLVGVKLNIKINNK